MTSANLHRGRKAEVKRIRRANRATAAGRLMLGEMANWVEFLQADTIDLESLPRRMLKSGARDVKRKVSKEVKRFCDRNFENMTEVKLDLLYEKIEKLRGIEIPLKEFEQKYSKIRKDVLKGAPPHCTVVISLWGLQVKFPEDYLAKDLLQALTLTLDANSELDDFKNVSHGTARRKKDVISSLIRKREQASRSCLLTCFNLVEAYFNGIAWDFAQDSDAFNKLSRKDQSRIKDVGRTSLREKILKYPRIITGQPLWDETEEPVQSFLTFSKPFRDSLVHPSPFSAPEKFGGYDKLRNFYAVDPGIAMWTTKITCDLIIRVHKHLSCDDPKGPAWLSELLAELDNYEFTETE